MKLTYDTSEHGSATEAVLELVDELTAELAGELVDLLPEALRGPVIRFMASSRACRQIAAAAGTVGVLRRLVAEHGQAINDYAEHPVYYLARALAAEPPELVRSGQWQGPRLGRRPKRRPRSADDGQSRQAAHARAATRHDAERLQLAEQAREDGRTEAARALERTVIEHPSPPPPPRLRAPPPRSLGWNDDGSPKPGELARRMRGLWLTAHAPSERP